MGRLLLEWFYSFIIRLHFFATFMCVATLVPFIYLKTCFHRLGRSVGRIVATYFYNVMGCSNGFMLYYFMNMNLIYLIIKPEDLEAGHYEFFRKLFWDVFGGYFEVCL